MPSPTPTYAPTPVPDRAPVPLPPEAEAFETPPTSAMPDDAGPMDAGTPPLAAPAAEQPMIRLYALDAAQRTWDYIEKYFIDKAHGEWFWRVGPDGTPDPNEPKVSEWKSPYHNVRACLETINRLSQIA